jgi:hypothetical protein
VDEEQGKSAEEIRGMDELLSRTACLEVYSQRIAKGRSLAGAPLG